MPIFMTDQNDTYLSHYPNATHHTTSDTNMSFIEINTKKNNSNCISTRQCRVILSVPDEGYSERTWWRLFWAYLMKVILSVPNEGYFERTWWRLFWAYLMKVILSVPNEGYFERTWWRLFKKSHEFTTCFDRVRAAPNSLPIRSTWVHHLFLIGFVLLNVYLSVFVFSSFSIHHCFVLCCMSFYLLFFVLPLWVFKLFCLQEQKTCALFGSVRHYLVHVFSKLSSYI